MKYKRIFLFPCCAYVVTNVVTLILFLTCSVSSYANSGCQQHLLTSEQRITEDGFEKVLKELERSIKNPKAGLFGPKSITWKINREMILFAGGIRAILLQLAHPYVSYAVEQHSSMNYNPIERFQRTFLFVSAMVFSDFATVKNASITVHRTHSRIKGTIPERAGTIPAGSEYAANIPEPMFWVFATLWDTAVQTYETFVGPLTLTEKNQYYQEGLRFTNLFGIPQDRLPQNWGEFQEYMAQMLKPGVLLVTPPAKKSSDFIQASIDRTLPRGLKKIKPALSAYTAYALPPHLAIEYGLLQPSDTTQLLLNTSLNTSLSTWVGKQAYKRLPKRLRWAPAYHRAMARLNGKPDSNYFSNLLNSWITGQHHGNH